MIRCRSSVGRWLLGLMLVGCGPSGDGSGGGDVALDVFVDASHGGAVAEGVSGVGDPGPILLGAVLSSDGPLKTYGQDMLAAVELAVAEVNAAGGVLGREVVVGSEPGGAEPELAVAAVESLVAQGAVAIVGPMASVAATEAAHAAAVEGVVMVSPSATSPALSGVDPWFFRTTASDAAEALAAADHAAGAGWTRAWIVHGDDDWGEAVRDAFTARFEGAGGTVYAVAHQEDVASLASELAVAAPDMVFVATFGAEATSLLGARVDEDVVWVFSSPAAVALDEHAQTEPWLVVEPDMAGTWHAAFEDRYLDAEGQAPGPFAANAYDAVHLVALAIAAAGQSDPASVRAALREVSAGGALVGPGDVVGGLEQAAAGVDVDYDGASGSCDLDEAHETPGEYEVVGP